MTLTESRSEHDTRVYGRFDTVQRRTRKGRSTFEVIGRRNRYHTGADPIREAIDDVELSTGVRLSGRNLAELADAWVARFHPEELSTARHGTRACECTDLTVRSLVIDRATSQPIWDRKAQNYLTRDMIVRRCHCGWESLVGTDLGMSWQQLTPNPYRCAYRGRRKSDPNRARKARTAQVRAAWADETETIAAHLAASDEPAVEIHDFPDVTIAIRRRADGVLSVTLTRGVETLRFRARTAGAIARRVIA